MGLGLLYLLFARTLFSQSVQPVNSVGEGRSASPVPLAGATLSSPQSTVTTTSALDAEPLKIGPGDLIEITVFDTPELSQKSRIDNAGEVELVVGGKLRLAGLSAAEANRAIEARLRDAKIMRGPHVSVDVVEYATQGVRVLGEVRNPGTYTLLGQHSVADLIADAGGLTQYASRTVSLIRQGSTSPVSINLNGSFQPTDSAEQALHPGDRIVVAHAGTVYVLGDVGRPGGYMLDDHNSMTLLQGLALAQGLNRTAKMHGSLIRNTAAGPQPELLDLKGILNNQSPDPVLRDGDIVYVPVNSAKDWASKGVNSILQMAVGVVIYGHY